MGKMIIRDARLEDAKYLLEIYSYYVECTAISFEYVTPTLAEFQTRMITSMKSYPYLVLEQDGVIKGYAYAAQFHSRAAYGWNVELTIYLDQKITKCGYGRLLYEALEEKLRNMGILNLYACIGYPKVEDEYLTRNSEEFHRHLGFKTVGIFHQCGYKFQRWYDMIWMEKIIGEHSKTQEEWKRY